MDDSGSFSETCNFYSNAVDRLQDSDDEDLPCTKTEDNCISEVLLEPQGKSLTITRRQQRRKEREWSPMCTRSGRRTRARTHFSWQRPESCDSPQTEMLNIVEINDDSCSSPEETVWKEFNADEGEIVWESGKSAKDILKEESNEADFSISGIDIEDEVAIHVKWRLKVSKVFHLKKTDTMKEIFQYFAQEEKIPESQILLTHNGKPISTYDTSEKFKGSVVIMLEGRLKIGNNSSEQSQEDRDPNQIELKVLRKDKKDKLSVFILRSDTLEVFMEKAAKQLDLPRSRLLFKFDGETLDSSDTPESLELDGGECIEVIVRP